MDLDMPVRHIGSLEVSLVGLGCNNFGSRTDEAQSARVVEAALDAGINFFDTADVYGGTRSEEYLGRALGKNRGEVVLATKFGMEVDAVLKGAAPAYVERALEDSLHRLGTDYVDLYQLHRPDPATPIADTLGALSELVRAGKAREIGCSNFSAQQLREARSATPGPHFVSVQNEYSLLRRGAELEVIPECEREGVAFIPFSPLRAGLLSGKYTRGEAAPAGTRIAGMPPDRQKQLLSANDLDAVGTLRDFAQERGHSVLELAIAWLAAKAVVASVIAGATRPEQVRANVKAAAWVLTDEEVAEVNAIAPAP